MNTAALRPNTPVRVRLSSFRTGERLEMLSKRVYVVAKTEGGIAWIRDGTGQEHRIAVGLLVRGHGGGLVAPKLGRDG